MKVRLLTALCAIVVCFLSSGPGRAQDAIPTAVPVVLRSGVAREECFPLNRLPANLRTEAERLLLHLLDTEALYTVIGGLKPMSSGYGTYKLDTKKPNTVPLEEARQIVATFRCGDTVIADILPFHRVDEKGTRYFEAVVFSRSACEQMVTTYPDFWAPYGITRATPPMNIALLIEHDPTTARNRGLGYLFGYPKHAVDFFVSAADAQGETKKFVKRDFINIATFESPTNRFVYAVPPGYKPAAEDVALREKAERILKAYRERRARYIGPDKPGVAA